MEEKKLNLYEKMQAVTNEINNISKDMNVGGQYKAVSDLAVTLAVNRAETKFKIISIPLKQEFVSSEIYRNIDTMEYVQENATSGTKQIDNKKTVKTTYIDIVKMTVRFIDMESPESFIDVESFGRGLDTGDKGFGKASTYARKYALLNAYKIPTGEDPDKDASPEHDKKDEQPKTEAKKQTPSFLDVNKAIDEMDNAKDRVDMTTVWNKYVGLQKDPNFMESARKTGLKYPKQ